MPGPVGLAHLRRAPRPRRGVRRSVGRRRAARGFATDQAREPGRRATDRDDTAGGRAHAGPEFDDHARGIEHDDVGHHRRAFHNCARVRRHRSVDSEAADDDFDAAPETRGERSTGRADDIVTGQLDDSPDDDNRAFTTYDVTGTTYDLTGTTNDATGTTNDVTRSVVA